MAHDFNDPHLPLAEMFAIWPETAEIFVARGMLCVGCPISPFHTITDACREYRLDEQSFRGELRRMIDVSFGQRPTC